VFQIGGRGLAWEGVQANSIGSRCHIGVAMVPVVAVGIFCPCWCTSKLWLLSTVSRLFVLVGVGVANLMSFGLGCCDKMMVDVVAGVAGPVSVVWIRCDWLFLIGN